MKLKSEVLFGIGALIIGAIIFLNRQRSVTARCARVKQETYAIGSAISAHYARYNTLPGARVNSGSEWAPSSKEVYRDFFEMKRPLMLYLTPRWQASLDLVD